jgi:dTDP-4-amino-4,6-dideoxygalactose transaminase
MDHIPFNRVTFAGNELAYAAKAMASGHVSGNGSFTRECETFLERTLGVNSVLLTTSCTHALELAALLLDIKAGDEVILPSFTFVSTANAFLLRGAQPIFADIRPDTLNLDETRLERLITSRTRVIVPVHYAGVGCEMDVISQVASRHGIHIVEDNAHGPFAKYRDKYLGTFGCLSTLSFHETKTFTCGEGGALLINDPRYAERAEIVREKGTNRGQFFRGQIDKYSWVDSGSSYVPSDILAAVLFAQFEQRDRIEARLRKIWEHYNEALRDWAGSTGTHLPAAPPHCDQSHHIFFLIMRSPAERDQLIDHLRSRGIGSAFHYVPLHLSKMGQRLGGRQGQCPVAEDIGDRLVRLPFYSGLTEEMQSRVLTAVREFCSAN